MAGPHIIEVIRTLAYQRYTRQHHSPLAEIKENWSGS
jgi:hypothetical protein